MNIIEKIKSYYSSKKKITIVLDIVFYLFILVMIIPSTRKVISTMIIRGVLHQPFFTNSPEIPNVYESDISWKLITNNGERLSFNDLEESVVFLNFWATWCPPCVAEMPGIQSLYNEFGNRVRFIMVSHEPEEKVKSFMDRNGYTLPTHLPLEQTPEIFSHKAIPTTFIISGSGKIVLKHRGATKWDGKKIKGMLEELADN